MSTNRVPFAILGLLGLAATAALVAQQQAPVSDTVMNPQANNPAAMAAGRQIFDGTCSNCHGQGAVGDRLRGAPALNTTGLAYGDGDADMFKTIRNGLPGTQMDGYKALTDTQIWQVITYLRTLQASTAPAVAGRGGAAAPAATSAAVAAGEAVFYGAKAGCATCHEVNGRGGVVGPDLSAIARMDAAALRQKITAPNAPAAAGGGAGGRGAAPARGGGGGGRGGVAPATLLVKMADGKTIRGLRRNEDTFSLQMIDATGQLHMIDKTKATVTVDPTSLMPADYGTRLTAGEIDSLVAFLGAQQARDQNKIMAQPMASGGIMPYDRLLKSKTETQNWPMYWGAYDGTHYSPLTQITPSNVSRLRPAWTFPIVGGAMEGTPVVVDGVMYATGPGNPTTVVALDARTGRQIWQYSRPQKVIPPNQINPYSRGVAIMGNRLYIGTLDMALVAIDARSGRQLWEVQVGDSLDGMSITSPPLVLKNHVIVGVSGGEFPSRGYLDSYDAASGKREWRFYTIPAPGEPGNDTWKGESWKTGGSPTWLTGTYDPELNTIYWPVGNPSPQKDRSYRGDGDNLYSDSVIALDPDTGKLKWHYQFTPNDGHDWDSVQDMVLVDRTYRGQQRKLLMHADRNSHFYVLDRTNGKFISGEPFVYQNWNDGFDANGRPKPRPNSNSSPEGSYLIYPALGGGTNFQSPSYSALTGWFYLSFSESGAQAISAPVTNNVRGQQNTGNGRGGTPATRTPADPEPDSGIKAFDPETGKTVWQFATFRGSNTNGVMATAGNVLFGSIADGNLVALDSKTGKHLWHYQTGNNHAAAPMSYSVDGKQYVTLEAGNLIVSFSLAE